MPIHTCPVCDASELALFVTLTSVPVHCNLLWEKREDALAAPRGDMQLGFCRTCSYIGNVAFDPALMEYTQQYENSLHFSPRFQSYATETAARLIERYDLRGKEIIEIGSGKGEFLTLLCEMGNNRGYGFDPSYVPDPTSDAEASRITFIQDFYSERYTHYSADLICCRHVLEHIQQPREFLTPIRNAIGDRPQTVLFFEVPNAHFMLCDLSFWDMLYEHCSYFSAGSLATLFRRCGFTVTHVSEAFGSQFLTIEAQPLKAEVAPQPQQGADDWSGLEAMAQAVATFAERYRARGEEWQHTLEEMKQKEQRVVVWGAGSKGVMFLNTLPTRETIPYVVDMNPRKHGMYVAGTGQQIVPPSFLLDYQPDVVIIMNPMYQNEIRQQMEAFDLTASYLDG